MPDPIDPTQPTPAAPPPPPPPPPPPLTSAPIADEATGVKSTTTGLPSNVAAALATVPLVGGIIFYILEKQDNFVRYYAMQSIVFGAIWILFNIVSKIVFAVFGSIPAIGGIFVFFWAILAALVHIVFLVIWVIALIKALTNVRWDIPYVGPIARKHVGEA
jgi:uncharacterized membrane protein